MLICIPYLKSEDIYIYTHNDGKKMELIINSNGVFRLYIVNKKISYRVKKFLLCEMKKSIWK